MSCREEMALLLSRYVDGEVSPEERDQVVRHISECEPCRTMLSLFQRNDNLLSSALTSESFGNVIVSAVSRAIRGETAPPEAKPVEEGLLESLRNRPYLPMAAGLLLAAGIGLVLLVVNGRQDSALSSAVTEQKAMVTEIREDLARIDSAVRQQIDLVDVLRDEHNREFDRMAARTAIQDAGEGHALAYVEPDHYVRVMASFNPKEFISYSVYRRAEAESDDRYVRLNGSRPLASPEFEDRTAERAAGYFYKFRAERANGEFVESAPIYISLPSPGDLSPEHSVRVYCEQTAQPGDMAIFLLERLVQGRPVRERFYVNLGQRVGEVRRIPGIGPVDFSTGLELAKIEPGHQPLEITYTAPVLDDAGRPMLQKLQGSGASVPLTECRSESLGVRENTRAILRPVEAKADSEGIRIWKGSWLRVRAPEAAK